MFDESVQLYAGMWRLWRGEPPRSSLAWTESQREHSLRAELDKVARAAGSLERALVEERARARSQAEREARSPPDIVPELVHFLTAFPQDWAAMAMFPMVGEYSHYRKGGEIPVALCR